MATFIEIHAIQTLPPSNPNRDEDGDPKNSMYGGCKRFRLSSQAQKRAARLHYSEYADLPRSQLAQRSRSHHHAVGDMLIDLLPDTDPDIRELSSRITLGLLNSSPEKLFKILVDEDGSNLLFLSTHELETISRIVAENIQVLEPIAKNAQMYLELEEKERKTFKAIPTKRDLAPISKALSRDLNKAIPGDVALFGRMMASLSDVSVDGCVQVAHAISVNPASRMSYQDEKGARKWVTASEIDFFTAVDDLSGQGIGHIGHVPLASPTYYRYANICLSELERLVGDVDIAHQFAAEFIKSFIETLPTGYQNSTAPGCRPEMVILQRRSDAPYSLLTAFESAIDNEDGISRVACDRLLNYRETVVNMFGDKHIQVYSVVAPPSISEVGVSLDDAIASVVG